MGNFNKELDGELETIDNVVLITDTTKMKNMTYNMWQQIEQIEKYSRSNGYEVSDDQLSEEKILETLIAGNNQENSDFTCPHCGAYASLKWKYSICHECKKSLENYN